MKNIFLTIAALITSTVLAQTSQAANAYNCRIFTYEGKHVKSVEAFNIIGFDTKEPQSENIDGGLLDYSRTKDTVTMSFSNECDNDFVFTFKIKDIKAAVNGDLRRLTGKAYVAVAGDDLEMDGVVSCELEK